MWQDIDTIPDDDTPKLIAFQNGEICIAHGMAKGPTEVTEDFDAGFTATHWMPLPAPPVSHQ